MNFKNKTIFCLSIFFLIFIFYQDSSKEIFQKNFNFVFLEQKPETKEFFSIKFSEKYFLKSGLPPVQIFSKSFAMLKEPKREILEYEVKEGETISLIAEKFSISKETIIWANDLSENSKLKQGQKLIILPVDGILHQVKKGETLSEIAKKYKANLKEIISYNEIEGEIYPGDILLIPGGKMSKSQSFIEEPLSNLSTSFFICPLPPCRITQGLHFYNAVDFSNGKCGEYVLAAASGRVIFAKHGWNKGAGNSVKILHPNGVISQYGHLGEILVEKGEEVYQGQIIGTVGSTGISTGCHLHFSVIGAKNPFAKY